MKNYHEKAERMLRDFFEYTKHGKNKDLFENRKNDAVIEGVLCAIGYYISKVKGKISFSEYVQCLSEDFANGRLKEARKEDVLPKYSEKLAIKHKIKAGFSEFETA